MKLNFPEYRFTVREEGDVKTIFDELRGKYVALTPEEWVRQHLIRYLIEEKKYPKSLIAVELPVQVGSMTQRADIVLYHTDGKPLLLAECKASEVVINQKTFDQIAVYNLTLKVPYLILSNGMKHYCCKMDFEKKKYVFLEAIPEYKDIISGL